MRLWLAILILAGSFSPMASANPKTTFPVRNVARATATKPVIRNPDIPLKVFEVRVNTQMEWLVLEQLMLGAQPTHFLKFRKGNRTKAMSVIKKADFDRWSKDIMAIKTGRQPACAQPFEAMANINGQKLLNRFCPGPNGDPAVRTLEKTTTEMLTYIRRNDALKGRGK